MKRIFVICICAICLFSCAGNKKENSGNKVLVADSSGMKAEIPHFFPVTDYIKGQVYDITNGSINPFKTVITPSKTDSNWLKMEDLSKEVSDFYTPEIDSNNLASLFAEKKFMDQTLNAVTFTYDPISTLPDTFSLRHWDVYVDPESQKVTRVYILKKLPQNKMQQLTWNTGKGCNIKIISEDTVHGKPIIEKQVFIKWDGN